MNMVKTNSNATHKGSNLEVYNDEIRDLLCDDNPNEGLRIIDHGERIEVRDLKSIEVETAEDVVIHMKDAARQRVTNPTEVTTEEIIDRSLQLILIC